MLRTLTMQKIVTTRGEDANNQNPTALSGGTPSLQASVKPTAQSTIRSKAIVAAIKLMGANALMRSQYANALMSAMGRKRTLGKAG